MLRLLTTTVIVGADTKVLPYHRPIVFAFGDVVLSRYSIDPIRRAQKEFFRQAQQPGRNIR
jgi:hypothetical protein